jgi:hypothetical protein
VYTDPDMKSEHAVPGYFNFTTCSMNYFWLLDAMPGTTYYVRARAQNQQLQYGEWSELFDCRTLGYNVNVNLFYEGTTEGIPGATVTLSAMDTFQAFTDISGFARFENLPRGQYTATVQKVGGWGGKGNSIDAMQIQRHFVGLVDFDSDLKHEAGDVNDDGVINSTDAMLVQRRFVGTVIEFTAGDSVFENVGFDLIDSDQNVTIYGRQTGDVN